MLGWRQSHDQRGQRYCYGKADLEPCLEVATDGTAKQGRRSETEMDRVLLVTNIRQRPLTEKTESFCDSVMKREAMGGHNERKPPFLPETEAFPYPHSRGEPTRSRIQRKLCGRCTRPVCPCSSAKPVGSSQRCACRLPLRRRSAGIRSVRRADSRAPCRPRRSA